MAYKALKPFKYQAANGVMKSTKAGQVLPEAAGWKHVDKLVRRRWITQEDGEVWSKRSYAVTPPKGRAVPPVEKKVVVTSTKVKEQVSPPPPPVDTPSPYTEDSLNKLLKSDVQNVAVAYGLSDDGTKTDLISAILEAQGV